MFVSNKSKIMKLSLIFLPVILTICISAHSVYSQKNAWFEDNFTSEDKIWKPSAPGYTRTDFSEGTLRIGSSDNKDRTNIVLGDIFVNPAKDFAIECEIRKEIPEKNKNYGLIWGARDQESYYAFTINTDQFFQITKTVEGKEKILKKKSLCTRIDSIEEFNTIKVEKIADVLFYSINGVLVHSSDYEPFLGAKIGFIAIGKQAATIDAIRIFQENKINTVSNTARGLVKKNLGPLVNSVHQEVVPVISHDGKTLYFHVIGDSENIGDNLEYGDIWYSEKVNDSVWTKRKNIGKPLNNDVVNFIFSISPDNNTLLISGQYNEDGTYLGPGISTSYRTIEGWSNPKTAVIDKFYNKSYFNDFCLSPNRKVLLQSIERDDTQGDRDLYVSFLKEDEGWTEPLNLGPSINTLGSEITPFLSADGTTLYYSTNGRPGYGSHDIFVSRRTDDSWTAWSEPQNLGNEINTPEWDAYYTIPASAEFAYLVSEENSLGKKDIFSIRLSEELKPQPVLLIYGKVLNSKTMEPLQASIAYNNLSTNEELGIASSDPKDGGYKLILPMGNEYSFLASKKDFISQSENVDAREITEYTEIERNLYLTPIEVGQVVRLNNIFFDFDKASLKPESYPELERVIDLLNTSKTVTIELSGHTDNKGSDSYNLELSQRRVNVVRDYIIEKGIKPERLTAKGYGETKPIAQNTHPDGSDNPEGRALNRRTEFKILSK